MLTNRIKSISLAIAIASISPSVFSAGIPNQGFPLSSAIWNDDSISVCWEDFSDSTSTQRGWVKSAIERTWSSVSNLRFTGWNECGNADIQIGVADAGPHTKGLGSQLLQRTNGMVLNFTYNNWSTGCIGNEQECSEDIAVHEFGHAIGFAHEQNRDDSPETCTADPQGTSGDVFIGKWDLDSVMNYCNPSWNGDGTLSDTDIRTAQAYYSSFFNGFEGGDLGDWTQSTTDQENWRLIDTPTPSGSTGPSAAVVGNFYAYLETSSGAANSTGDSAELVSPTLTGTNRSLAFDYHMFGSDMGTLSVDVHDGSSWQNNIWSISGEQNNSPSDKWHRVNIDLSSYTGNIQVRLRGVADGGYRGDMAIDNLALYGDNVKKAVAPKTSGKVAEYGDPLLGNSYNGCRFNQTYGTGGGGYEYKEYSIACDTGTYEIGVEINYNQYNSTSCKFHPISSDIYGSGSCDNWRVYAN